MTNSDPKLGSNYWKLLGASTISNLGDGIGLIAYPWLASAITRNPILISLVAVVQRLPWLLFSLPAGVITDRHDRRSIMVGANTVRAIITLIVAAVVLNRQGMLPGPDDVESVVGTGTDTSLYAMVLVATLLLGMAEVLYDNSGQTLMPLLVEPTLLEKANGRLWSTEQVTNQLIGPPLGSVLLIVAFSVPFLVDAATFAVSAALIALIVPTRRSDPKPARQATSWSSDLAEGVRWLWGHQLLRSMAIILGLMNMLFMMSGAILVLFAQEVLDTTPTEFAILTTGGALGGIIGGLTASAISKRIGPGKSLSMTLSGLAAALLITGTASQWPLVWLMITVDAFLGTLWNVITVSLRQSIIPDHLLGRVNSVYRFFAWGMMPIGAILGGLIVVIAETQTARETALRIPWFVAGIAFIVLFAIAAPMLTTAKLEAARDAATSGDA